MEANELRIANLVKYEINDTFSDRKPYYGKSIYQVNVIMDDRVKLEIGFDALQPVLFSDPKLKPIPLTEDWLLKLGFEDKIVNGFSGFYQKGIIILLIEDGEYDVELAHNIKKPAYMMTCKYVHQLQNLYFALTGEELTIKN